MQEFSFYVHYQSLPPSLQDSCPRRVGDDERHAEADEDEEDYVDELVSELGFPEVQKRLSSELLALVEEQDRSLFEGVSVRQYSPEPEEPVVFRLPAGNVRALAGQGRFFWVATGTERWRKSRHLLLSFFVISFAEGGREAQLAGVDGLPAECRMLEHGGRRFWLVGNNGSWQSFLTSLRALAGSVLAADECRIDYFTPTAWVDLMLDEELVWLAEKGLSLSVCIHQSMKIDAHDELKEVFSYLLRNRPLRAFINAEAQQWGIVVTRRKRQRRRRVSGK